jgi:hypothetical protein
MSDQLQRQADELDALITAMKRGETQPATSLNEAETRLTAELLNLAASTELDPEFRQALGAQLYRAASQAARPRPVPLTFWQKVEQGLSDFTMKRFVFTFGSLAAVAVIVLAIVFFRPDGEGDQDIVAGNPTSTVANVVTPVTDVADVPTNTAESAGQALAALPELQGMDTTGGMGGGGDGTSPAPEIDMTRWEPVNVFSGTTFVLDATLPTGLGPNTVLQQTPWVMDVATARQIANQWGFTGPLYTMPLPEQPDGEPAIILPPTYFVFDGTRMFQLDASFIYYNDTAVMFDPNNPTPFEQARAVAESFFQARGLLDFPYGVRQGFYPNEVNFYRLVDGLPVNQYEVYASVVGDQVATAHYTALSRLENLGGYPLTSVEEAWQKLLFQATVAGRVLYEVMPAEMVGGELVIEEPQPEQPLTWVRTYQPGQEAHLYSWATIYLPAEGGDTPPRIETYPLRLQTDDETLRALAALPTHLYHIWGTVGADGKTLQVTGFEGLDETTHQPLFIEGTIRREGDQIVVTAFTGENYVLPNPPADLPEGMEVTVFAFASRDAGLAYPVLEWDNINERVIFEAPPVEEPPVVIEEPIEWQPFIYQNVTVTQVELAYYYTYVQDQEAIARGEFVPATILLQPAWKFTGTADNGDMLTFYMQAVSTEYVEPAE